MISFYWLINLEYLCCCDCGVKTCICHCPRRSLASVVVDLSSVERWATSKRCQNYLACGSIVVMHHPPFARGIHVSYFCCCSSNHYRIRVNCLYVSIYENLTLVGRFFLTPDKFRHARWNLGKWSRPMQFVALIWNLYAAAVLFSPIYFPVTNQTFNYACVIFGAITIFAFMCWWWMPEDEWLKSKRIAAVIDANS